VVGENGTGKSTILILIKVKLNVSEVQTVIGAAVGGAQAGFIFEGTLRFDILVRYPLESRKTREAIEKIIRQSDNGIRVPLIELVQIEEIVGSLRVRVWYW